MLENLMSLVKEQAGDAIVSNPAIPNERNQEAIAETGNSIVSGLQNMMAGGGMKDVLKMFGQGDTSASNPVVQNLSGGVVENLMHKFGLDKQAAGGIAGSLVPSIMKKLVSKTNDPNDNSFDLQSIFNTLSNGKTQGTNISDLAGKFTKGGLDKDGDGDVDLQDVSAMFSSNQQGSSGILDTVKGLFN
jgi:hypothetical protein